jgi:hypothetical protein
MEPIESEIELKQGIILYVCWWFVIDQICKYQSITIISCAYQVDQIKHKMFKTTSYECKMMKTECNCLRFCVWLPYKWKINVVLPLVPHTDSLFSDCRICLARWYFHPPSILCCHTLSYGDSMYYRILKSNEENITLIRLSAGLFFSFTHMCIQCLAHFSPLPLAPSLKCS